MEENKEIKEKYKLNSDKLKELVSKSIDNITQEGIQVNDLNTLSQLVDIHKDLCNEEYWKVKKEELKMRYPEYRDYGRNSMYYRGDDYNREEYGRRSRDSRGRYMHHGEEMIDDMHGAYRNYSNGKDEMNMGNYGAKQDTMKSLHYMMQSVVDFIEMLKKDANSQEEVQLIKDYTRKINEM